MNLRILILVSLMALNPSAFAKPCLQALLATEHEALQRAESEALSLKERAKDQRLYQAAVAGLARALGEEVRPEAHASLLTHLHVSYFKKPDPFSALERQAICNYYQAQQTQNPELLLTFIQEYLHWQLASPMNWSPDSDQKVQDSESAFAAAFDRIAAKAKVPGFAERVTAQKLLVGENWEHRRHEVRNPFGLLPSEWIAVQALQGGLWDWLAIYSIRHRNSLTHERNILERTLSAALNKFPLFRGPVYAAIIITPSQLSELGDWDRMTVPDSFLLSSVQANDLTLPSNDHQAIKVMSQQGKILMALGPVPGNYSVAFDHPPSFSVRTSEDSDPKKTPSERVHFEESP